MSAVTVAVTTLGSSSSSSSSVARLSSLLPWPTPNTAVVGRASLNVEPVSVTLTLTVSDSVVGPVRDSVNVAAAPSVTGLVPASMETSGRSSAWAKACEAKATVRGKHRQQGEWNGPWPHKPGSGRCAHSQSGEVGFGPPLREQRGRVRQPTTGPGAPAGWRRCPAGKAGPLGLPSRRKALRASGDAEAGVGAAAVSTPSIGLSNAK